MTIRDLLDEFEIQGAYCIKAFDNDEEMILARGGDFQSYNIKRKYLNMEVLYMYSSESELVIEVEML